MASVIFHSFRQIIEDGTAKLFRSYRADIPDGQQRRDFVYVKDVAKVIFWMMRTMTSGQWDIKRNGIYNLGTGEARTFSDLTRATFRALDTEPRVTFIDMPEDIRNTYQYVTQAVMEKLRASGYTEPFYTLEDGVDEYVRKYLAKNAVY
jgi:ADP-L-glycero-D-manno-heptose 6-epimerase